MAICLEYWDPGKDPVVAQSAHEPARMPPQANSANAQTSFFADYSSWPGSQSSTCT